jgi:hypothetical protein
MKLPRRQFLHLTAAAAGLPAVSRVARAQTYPTRPITIVVGYAAGGPLDTVARILAERVKAVLGQPVLVENTTGAGGSIAVGRVVRAAPDGYTVSMGDMGNYIANEALYPLRYDLRTDLQPVAMVANAPHMVVARNGMPASDLKELIAWLRANPNKGFAGTGGIGSIIHPDATKVNLQKSSGYVWVISNMEEVIYLYKPSREADFLHKMLERFEGVLITDFFTGYDSLPCLQQKCLIHLMRDVNDDLLKNPFDREQKELATLFGQLLRRMAGVRRA